MFLPLTAVGHGGKLVTLSTFKQAYTNNRWLNNDAEYTVAAGYNWLRQTAPKVVWRYVCWNRLNVPKHSFIFWAWMHHKLLTKDRLIAMGLQVDGQCDLCMAAPESHEHLLCDCVFSRKCLKILHDIISVQFPLKDLVVWYKNRRGKYKLVRNYIGACHVALMYALWKARNEARMNQVVPRPEAIISQLRRDIKARLLRMNASTMKPSDCRWLTNLDN
ncbi:uncharacterized protein LOC141607552 [Silene latifolia]|uniref:uncharacterized protein LOC141607552 n=1 Tax=Silene latifolia TaxID=37657 RepID=UPI003D77B0DE